MTTHAPTDPLNANRTRLGGILLTAGVALVLVRAIMGFTLFPTSFTKLTSASMAQNLVAHQGAIPAFALVSGLAALLLATGAFCLVTRPVHTPRAFPASALWLLFGVGELLALGRAIVFGTGYLSLATNYSATNPMSVTLFDATSSTLGWVSTFAGLSIYAALTCIFASEARSATASLPTPVSWVGALCALLVFGSNVAGLFNATALSTTLGFAFYPTVLIGLAFGFRLGWPNLSMAPTSQPDRNTRLG